MLSSIWFSQAASQAPSTSEWAARILFVSCRPEVLHCSWALETVSRVLLGQLAEDVCHYVVKDAVWCDILFTFLAAGTICLAITIVASALSVAPMQQLWQPSTQYPPPGTLCELLYVLLLPSLKGRNTAIRRTCLHFLLTSFMKSVMLKRMEYWASWYWFMANKQQHTRNEYKGMCRQHKCRLSTGKFIEWTSQYTWSTHAPARQRRIHDKHSWLD